MQSTAVGVDSAVHVWVCGAGQGMHVHQRAKTWGLSRGMQGGGDRGSQRRGMLCNERR